MSSPTRPYALPAPALPSNPVRMPIQGPLAGLRGWISNISASEWFTPGQPVAPQAPPGTPIRAQDYQVGLNLQFIPRGEEDLTFQQLRQFAQLEYLTALAIETRKDQVANMSWTIRPVRDPGEGLADYKRRSEEDTTTDAIQQLFERPDGYRDWESWIRTALEDVLVIDALTLYPFQENGRSYLEVIDGSTIKRLIDVKGRPPMPPEPAFQQIIKGVPANNYSSDELLYRPRNPRVHKIYGYSPVEQIITVIMLALKRYFFKLSYYTEGNIPEALIQLPAEWPLEQVKQFQLWFDSILAGQVDVRRRAFFMPGVAGKDSIVFPKQDALKDEMDEWLARVVCYAFSLPPTAFVAVNNRATAQTSQEAAKQEGLRPLLNWLRRTLTGVIQGPLGYDGYEWAWDEELEADPLKRAQIQALQLRNAVKSPNEVREENGDDPVDGGDQPGVVTATGFAPLGASTDAGMTDDTGLDGGEAPPPTQKPGDTDSGQAPTTGTGGVTKAGDPHAFRSRAARKRLTTTSALLTRFLKRQGDVVATRLAAERRAAAKVVRGAAPPLMAYLEEAGVGANGNGHHEED